MLSQGAIIGEHLSNLGQIINTLQNDFRTGLFGQHDPHFINGHVVDINQTINQLLSSVPQPITLDNLQAVLENSGSSADSVGSGLSSGASTGEMNATLPEYSVTNQIPGNTIFNALLEKLNSQGQQLFNDVQTQSIINQNRMDQYKEQFTNVIDSINNILRTQHDGGQQAITNMKSR
jgi:hypothetical protein